MPLSGFWFVLLAILSVTDGQRADSQGVSEWVAEPGGRVEQTGDSIAIARGTVRTLGLYSDFVLRFDFRQREPDADARVLVRSRFDYGTAERGYRIALNSRAEGDQALGRISVASVALQQRGFSPSRLSGAPEGWQQCEIRAERDRLTVSINGAVVSTAEELDEFTGHIAFQSRRERVELKNIRIERLAVAGIPFGRGAHREKDPDVVSPRPTKTVKPFYPRAPHDAWIQGTVALEAVVETNGTVGDVRVMRSVHPDLDEAAIGSVRQWRFKPGKKSGREAPVIVEIEVEFKRTG